jgi:hypothetical protein
MYVHEQCATQAIDVCALACEKSLTLVSAAPLNLPQMSVFRIKYDISSDGRTAERQVISFSRNVARVCCAPESRVDPWYSTEADIRRSRALTVSVTPKSRWSLPTRHDPLPPPLLLPPDNRLDVEANGRNDDERLDVDFKSSRVLTMSERWACGGESHSFSAANGLTTHQTMTTTRATISPPPPTPTRRLWPTPTSPRGRSGKIADITIDDIPITTNRA